MVDSLLEVIDPPNETIHVDGLAQRHISNGLVQRHMPMGLSSDTCQWIRARMCVQRHMSMVCTLRIDRHSDACGFLHQSLHYPRRQKP